MKGISVGGMAMSYSVCESLLDVTQALYNRFDANDFVNSTHLTALASFVVSFFRLGVTCNYNSYFK